MINKLKSHEKNIQKLYYMNRTGAYKNITLK